MSAQKHYIVTGDRSDTSYRVTLRDTDDGCEIQVEHGDEASTFFVTAGPDHTQAWVEAQPRRVEWRTGDGDKGTLVLDGVPYGFTVVSETRHRLASLAPLESHATHEIRASMPGLVLLVEVEDGHSVNAGDGLAIIEAMKMENEITAPTDGIVRDLSVRSGQPIEQGSLICVIEPAGESE
jgi:biotin carboxyl carrier protein